MNLKDFNRLLALAGIFQAAYLVKQYALTGQIEEEAFQSSLRSIFKTDAPDVPAVFGGLHPLQTGLLNLVRFGRKKPPFKDNALLRYVLHMGQSGKRLLKDKELFKELRRRLEPALSQAQHLGADHPVVLNNLATIYSRTFLTRQLRIPIVGRADLLQQPMITEKLRTLLLAGIRAALLWYQMGGNRWQLFLFRSRIATCANSLLYPEQINTSSEVKS